MPSSITIENEDVEPLNASFVLFKIYLLVLGLWFSIGFSKGIMKLLSVDPESLPPGPRGLPLIGNELQIPRDKQWLCFDRWSKQYGDIISISSFGQTSIILSSAQAALDLLETKGNIYSDRPRVVMAGELVGWDQGLGYSRYGERFKEFRRMFHQTLGPRSIQDLYGLQETETHKLLLRIHRDPISFIDHARQSSGSMILKLAYGYTAKEENDPMSVCTTCPSISWSHRCEDYIPSFTSSYLLEDNGPSQDLVKAAAASLYSGGAETTPSSITSFILAMALYPDVQAKGQNEIDLLLKGKRLPKSSDRDSLPYVNAIVKEVLRWNPSIPLGLPHRAMQDDEYREFLIKEGTILWANIWSILHDETKICPGMHLADNSIFLAVSSILAVFNIRKTTGHLGEIIDPIVDYSGFISHPRPFQCVIEVRSKEADSLICHEMVSET
ncbi:cytochrome P450 [Pyrrhoderma noxium]|uniref:Cytochrome P450 n=1 Tax=Pyrrhoderma noxium TaxID=2282107 RepID=A0A286UHU4_9AGAM|nr:cytochrome P450 [Pyrrhoderma noxium]